MGTIKLKEGKAKEGKGKATSKKEGKGKAAGNLKEAGKAKAAGNLKEAGKAKAAAGNLKPAGPGEGEAPGNPFPAGDAPAGATNWSKAFPDIWGQQESTPGAGPSSVVPVMPPPVMIPRKKKLVKLNSAIDLARYGEIPT